MDRISGDNPMENPPHPPLAGLDPADLLRQGAAADTFAEDASAFHPPCIEELAPLFPQFEILTLIGQGGMGAVYQVRQKDLDRIVALKILPPAIGETAGFSDRFAREAKALARLNHPGIVTIHEFGQREGFYFILMEFVDGVNLAQLMRTGRIAPREALAIVPQICDALQYAHDQGIVHRDIKPENLLLDRLGRVKVADFGIAKIVSPSSSHVVPPSGGSEAEDRLNAELPAYTEAGKIIGTPQYMAPEQIDHPSEVDHRADIYALGVVFYQMLTGELPGRELQAPSRKVRIDVRLDEMVLRAMDSNPERRYQTADEFRTVVEGMRTSPPAIVPAPRSRYYDWLLWSAVGICFLAASADIFWAVRLLGFGGVAGWVFWHFFVLPYRAGLDEARTMIAKTHPSSRMKLVETFFILLMIGTLIVLTLFAAIVGPSVWRNIENAMKQESHLRELSSSPVPAAPIKGDSSDRDDGIGGDDSLLAGRQAQVGMLKDITVPEEAVSMAEKPEAKAATPKQMVITILTEGSVKVDGQAFSLLDLSEELKKRVKDDRNVLVAIRCPATLPYEGVRTVTDLCQEAGVWNLTFADHEGTADLAMEWLGKMDAGSYAECYTGSAAVVKSTMTEEKWKEAMILFRTPLGAVISRKIKNSKNIKQLPGVPDGEHLMMQFDTEFTNKKTAVETVVFTKDKDGIWKSSGYFIR